MNRKTLLEVIAAPVAPAVGAPVQTAPAQAPVPTVDAGVVAAQGALDALVKNKVPMNDPSYIQALKNLAAAKTAAATKAKIAPKAPTPQVGVGTKNPNGEPTAANPNPSVANPNTTRPTSSATA